MFNHTQLAGLATTLVLIAMGGCDQRSSGGSDAAGAASVPSAPATTTTATQASTPGARSTMLSTTSTAPSDVDVESIPIGYAVGQRAPEWRLRDPNGREHALSDYRGHVVVMDFWATWCGPCRMAMPGMQKLHEELGARNVKVFGITTGETGNPAAYMASKNFTYGLLLNGDKVAGQYGVRGIPAFFVVGVDGRVIHRASGFDRTGQAERDLHAAIVQHLDDHGL